MITNNARAIAGRIVITPTRPEAAFDNAMQSTSFKRRIIAEATKDGSLHELRWFVEFRAPVRTLPPHLRPPAPWPARGCWPLRIQANGFRWCPWRRIRWRARLMPSCCSNAFAPRTVAAGLS